MLTQTNYDRMFINYIAGEETMQDGNNPTTLSSFVCQPFYSLILRDPTRKPYVRGIDYLLVKAQLYAIGAALGHALRHKLDMFQALLFVPTIDQNERNRLIGLFKADARKNLEAFKNQHGYEPPTFLDFGFFSSIEHVLQSERINLTPREAFQAYLNGDRSVRKLKKMLDAEVDAKGIGQEIIIMFLQGIHFGSSFPELTETMYRNLFEHDMDFWDNSPAQGLVIPKEMRAKTLEETQRSFLSIVTSYVSQHYPELLDSLGLAAFS